MFELSSKSRNTSPKVGKGTTKFSNKKQHIWKEKAKKKHKVQRSTSKI